MSLHFPPSSKKFVSVLFLLISRYNMHFPGGQCFITLSAAKRLGEYLQLNKNGFH